MKLLQRFGSAGFEAIYRGQTAGGPKVPWDIGEPQPAIVELADNGEFTGRRRGHRLWPRR